MMLQHVNELNFYNDKMCIKSRRSREGEHKGVSSWRHRTRPGDRLSVNLMIIILFCPIIFYYIALLKTE